VTRALCTFATGGHQRLLELSLPRMAEYAERHGYELYADPPLPLYRPASWMKVLQLLACLREHDAALWIDCDVVIRELDRDLADDVAPDAWQALVRHHTADGEVPNCGVWYCRKAMRSYLQQMWRLDRYTNHPWWEQAAMLDLLGYRHDPRPVELAAPTGLYLRTSWLGLEWNSHTQSDPHPQPRFAHATCGSLAWREQVMRDHLERSVPCPSTC
jgi:hypothetical protein